MMPTQRKDQENLKIRLHLHLHRKANETKSLNEREIVMMWNRCTRKRENVPKMIMKTLLDLQKLRKMENLIEKREAVVVLPHLLENLIPRAESDICPLCLCQN